uniref:Carrier domain-containing protein n=1 Tax=Panagrolaimus superbus TaxID=310955 RepID=A0A914ZES6_9BILA
MAWEVDGFEEKVPKISNTFQHLNVSNMITVDFDKRDITVILMEVFEKYEKNIALKSEKAEITYKNLQKQILQISNQIKEEYFKAFGCLFGPDTIIPVISKNSIEQWLICLGVIFAGGAYLPIDAKTPEERILKILKQLAPTLIISDEIIPSYKSMALTELISNNVVNSRSMFKTSPTNAYNLAYIIFTSGTTGIPKGVCINRLGISNLILGAQKFLSINSNSIIYQFTNFCFDNSILEVFAALGSGATCFISDGYFSADKFCQNITDYGITHAMLFPGLIETFDDNELAQFEQLKYWICGAEKLSENLFKRAMSLGINIIQNYGPTETTAYCLRKKLGPKDDPQNLGTPIQNAIVTVRRPDGWEAMIGSKFELFIASVGLTRGYLGRKWKDQPFVTFGDGLIYYPSGDICQRLKSGDIRFVGRKDNQVKIRGFRIELDEIESCLLGYPTINTAKILLNQKKEDIIAFYSSKIQIEKKELKDFLKQKLPYYMIPRFFIFLETFPFTSNSKIDTKKLIEYELKSFKGISFDGTNVPMETAIKQIWKNILNLDSSNFDLNDSFFYLGGNSLTAQKLITRIKNELKLEIKMEEFYRNPTISSIFKMAKISQEESIQIFNDDLSVFDKIPLSYQQEQMLYLEQIDPESSYNLTFIQEFDKNLDIKKLKAAFFKLVEENTVFRTIFKESEDDLELYQEILPMDKCFIDVKVESFNNTNIQKLELKEFKHAKFDLFNEIPLRVKILETQNSFVILLVVHHAFSDATTTMLMEKEMSRLYQGKEKRIISSVRPMSYQEYSIKQKSKEFKENLEALTLEYLENYNSIFKLPPAKFESIFKTCNFTQLCETFKFRLSLSKSKYTPFTLITAAITKTFVPLFPEDSFLLLGFPFANRTMETSEIFGNFLNNLLLPLTSKDLNISLDELQLKLLELLKYGKIPFQYLCKSLRQKQATNSMNIQIYVNCRYDLENEAELDFDEIDATSTKIPILNGVFEDVTNYPIEIDLDELKSTKKTSTKNYEITVRISKAFLEANAAMEATQFWH